MRSTAPAPTPRRAPARMCARCGFWSFEHSAMDGICHDGKGLFKELPPRPKDHRIAQAINELRDIAIEFHGTQQLRERIAGVVLRLLGEVRP